MKLVEGNTKQQAGRIAWHFVLNNYTEKDYSNIIQKFSSKALSKIETWIVGKEIGEQNGIPHLQGYCRGSDKFRWTELKFTERVQFIAPDGSMIQNLSYCAKDGKYETNYVGIIPKYAKKKTIKPIKIITDLLPFQSEIEEIIKGPVNEGKIIWFHDSKGQIGKTQLVRYLNVKYGIPFAYGGKCSDIINIAFNNKKYLECEESPCFIFNLPRTTDKHKISYNSMEQISDGAIANTKFEGNCFVFNQPHVIVFANCLPDYDSLTLSRWLIYKIKDNHIEKFTIPEDDEYDE